MASTTLSRWQDRLKARRLLLAAARSRFKRAHRKWEKAKKAKKPMSVRTPLWRDREKKLDLLKKRERQVNYAQRVVKRNSFSWAWGGSRGVTNEVIGIVNGRAATTSRKRVATFGNPGSDHHVSQRSADAVDFAIAEAHWLKNEISRRLGGPSTLADYGSFYIRRKGKRFRVQIIAGTHGTGPHLHVGVRRA
jgi:hypothetical protein